MTRGYVDGVGGWDRGRYGVMVSVAFSPRVICGTPSSHPLITLPTPIDVSNGFPSISADPETPANKAIHGKQGEVWDARRRDTAFTRRIEFLAT